MTSPRKPGGSRLPKPLMQSHYRGVTGASAAEDGGAQWDATIFATADADKGQHLGSFGSEQEAARAFEAAALSSAEYYDKQTAWPGPAPPPPLEAPPPGCGPARAPAAALGAAAGPAFAAHSREAPAAQSCSC